MWTAQLTKLVFYDVACRAKSCHSLLCISILNISHSQTISIKQQVECIKILTTILTTGGFFPTSAYHLCQARKTDGWKTSLDCNLSCRAHCSVPSHNTELSLTHAPLYQWRLLYSALLEDRDLHLNIKFNSHSQIVVLVTPLLTYSMVQSPSWEANWFAACQEFPRILWNPKVHYRTQKRPPPAPIVGQPNPVHKPTSHVLEIHPNIIHPSKPRSPQWSLSLRFPQQYPIRPPLLTHTRHMPSPSNSLNFILFSSVIWKLLNAEN